MYLALSRLLCALNIEPKLNYQHGEKLLTEMNVFFRGLVQPRPFPAEETLEDDSTAQVV